MTVRVPEHFPGLPTQARLHIGRPVSSGHHQDWLMAIAHLLGAQLSLVHCQAFGPAEADDATRRFAWAAHPNARNLVIAIVPWGYPSGPTYGEITSIQVGGVEKLAAARRFFDAQADMPGIFDIPESAMMDGVFVVDGTPNTLQEVTWTTSNLRPHSIVAYEARRTLLDGTDKHVDRSYADPRLKITDDPGAGGRGQKALLDMLEIARANTRRHLISFGFAAGASENAGVFTSLYPTLRAQARAMYAGETETPTRAWFYVGSIAGGSTHEIRIRDAGTVDTGSVAGVNATGWWPSLAGGISGGVSFSMENAAWDDVIIDSKTTAGAGAMRVDSVLVLD